MYLRINIIYVCHVCTERYDVCESFSARVGSDPSQTTYIALKSIITQSYKLK